MEPKWTEAQLIDYLAGELPADEATALAEDLLRDPLLKSQCGELSDLLNHLDKLPPHQPSPSLQQNFAAMLQQALTAERPTRRLPARHRLNLAAAALALLVIGVLIGLQLSKHGKQALQLAQLQAELSETKKVMVQLMQQDRTSSRIKAVYLTQEFNEPDPEIIAGLTHLLQNDQSPNVRLAAIDALLQFSQTETAREALKKSLLLANKPVVQIALIHALVQIGDKSALPYFDRIIENREIIEKVKDEARLGQFKML